MLYRSIFLTDSVRGAFVEITGPLFALERSKRAVEDSEPESLARLSFLEMDPVRYLFNVTD